MLKTYVKNKRKSNNNALKYNKSGIIIHSRYQTIEKHLYNELK